MKKLATLLTAVAITACAAPDRRQADTDIPTRISPGVLAIAEAENGVVDTDKHTDVHCERVKIVGTHLHERICYTQAESRAAARRHADAYYRRFGAGNRCLDQTSCDGN